MTRILRRRAVASGAVVALIVGAGVATLPAAAVARPAAVKLDGLSFLPAVQSLTSNTHKTLRVQLGSTVTKQSGTTSTSLNVTVTRHGTPEMHAWYFNLKNGSLSYSPARGKGSLHVGSQVEPYSKITLSLTATGKKHVSTCQTYKTITQPVKVRGAFSFDTRSKGKGRWGKVGGSAKRTFAGRSEVVYETGLFHACTGNFVFPCSSEISWSAVHSGTADNEVALSGGITKVHGKNHGRLFATRNVSLSKPKGALRSDSVNITDNRMTFIVSSSKASIRLGASGPVSGSATLISPAAGQAFSIPCGKAGKMEIDTSWHAPYKNGKSPLAVHEQIEGSIRLPNIPLSASEPATIDRETIS